MAVARIDHFSSEEIQTMKAIVWVANRLPGDTPPDPGQIAESSGWGAATAESVHRMVAPFWSRRRQIQELLEGSDLDWRSG